MTTFTLESVSITNIVKYLISVEKKTSFSLPSHSPEQHRSILIRLWRINYLRTIRLLSELQSLIGIKASSPRALTDEGVNRVSLRLFAVKDPKKLPGRVELAEEQETTLNRLENESVDDHRLISSNFF